MSEDSINSVSFQIDDVKPRGRELVTLPAKVVLRKKIGPGPAIIASSLNDDSIEFLDFDQYGICNALVESVLLAYGQHRKLVLDPDAIWLTIAGGFAIHQQIMDEDRKPEDKEVISIESLQIDHQKKWPEWLKSLASEVVRREPKASLLIPAFSTTGDVERAVGAITVMSAFKARYKYEMRLICGIPQLTLLGEAKDWEEIRRRAEGLTEGDLAWWRPALLPILDQFVLAAKGDIDTSFWQEMCQTKAVYGSKLIGGWVTKLFPYCNYREEQIPNPMIVGWDDAHRPPKVRRMLTDDGGKQIIKDGDVVSVVEECEGLWPSLFPHGLSSVVVDFPLGDADGAERKEFEVIGGMVGIIDTDQGLHARAGWAVRLVGDATAASPGGSSLPFWRRR